MQWKTKENMVQNVISTKISPITHNWWSVNRLYMYSLDNFHFRRNIDLLEK